MKCCRKHFWAEHKSLSHALIWKAGLVRFCPVTSPCWPRYSVWKTHNIRVDTPCSDKANHKAPQSPRSKIFDKPKLNIHTGMFAAKVLSTNKFAVSKCSSKRRLARTPCCSSGWWLSKVSEWGLHAQIGSPFRVQARTTNDIYISSSTDFSACKKIESLSPNCKQGGQLVEHVLGANSMLEQPIVLLAKWKHS